MKSNSTPARILLLNALVAVLLLGLSTLGHAAANIIIVNGDSPGEGFNDTTPAVPVGGNPGTTLGQQRLNAFQHAASIWGTSLDSTVTIFVLATFDPLSCTATSAVLGAAGPTFVARDFAGAGFAGTWYHIALANKLAGVDLVTGNPHIQATFNSNLGLPGCLTGSGFYLGLDNNHGPLIDLVTVLLHEFGHGLGFSTVTSSSSGARLLGFPSVYDRFLLDTTTNKLWVDMTNAERVASAVNARNVVWTGNNVNDEVPNVLQLGTPELNVSSPPFVAGDYDVGTASFGPSLAAGSVTGRLMPIIDNPAAQACTPLNATNAFAVAGNIALIDRGGCTFTTKVKNAQDAGAIGVVIADNVAGAPPPGLGGSDPTIVIPSVRITQADGNLLKDALRFRSRGRSGVVVTMGVDSTQFAGADANDRMLMYTPTPLAPGSSVSHWDTIATPNQLMEPFINADLTHSVEVPQDMTVQHLRDVGW